MGTPAAAAGVVRLSHLLPCPNCAADNGVTARFCWRCEGPLLRKRLRAPEFELPQPTVAEPAAEQGPPAAAPEVQQPHEPEPSFFPVLHDEAAGFQTAANDHPVGEPAMTFLRPRGPSRRVIAGAACGVAAAVLLGAYMVGRSVSGTQEAKVLALASSAALAPDATLVLPAAHVAAPAARPTIEPSAAATPPDMTAARRPDAVAAARAAPKPAAAKPAKAKRRAASPATANPLAPAGPATCAPEVVALGLCGAGSH